MTFSHILTAVLFIVAGFWLGKNYPGLLGGVI